MHGRRHHGRGHCGPHGRRHFPTAETLLGRLDEYERVPGTEVLAVELLAPDRFCVYIDHPQGVDHALCERVTRELDEYRRDYAIDVSSPGTERPLRTPAHFAGAVGRRVKLRTSGEIE